jgi:hypothetical protein
LVLKVLKATRATWEKKATREIVERLVLREPKESQVRGAKPVPKEREEWTEMPRTSRKMCS